MGSIIRQCAANAGVKQRQDISTQEVIERLIFPVINEGFKIYEEGFAYKASDIDMVCVFGYNFPRIKGGPMHYASEIGLRKLQEGLNHYKTIASTGKESYWQCSSLLDECVRTGQVPDAIISHKNSIQLKSKL